MVAGPAAAATEAAAARGAARAAARAAGAKVARGAWTEIGAPWGAAEVQAEMRVAVVQGVVQVAGTAALGGWEEGEECAAVPAQCSSRCSYS